MAYRWDPELLRYRDESGRVVPAQHVRRLVEQLVERAKEDLAALAADYMAGAISRREWEEETRELIRTVSSGAAAVAVGGAARLQPNDWATVGREVERQMRFFERFSDNAARGALSEAQAAQQAAQYASAAWVVHSEMETRVAAQSGYDEERWVTHPNRATSCEDCVEWAKLGWVPLGTLPKIGESRCRGNCRCHKQHRRTQF